jgi:hypothetical protein
MSQLEAPGGCAQVLEEPSPADEEKPLTSEKTIRHQKRGNPSNAWNKNTGMSIEINLIMKETSIRN